MICMKNIFYILFLYLFLSLGVSPLQAQNLKPFDPSKTNQNRPKKTKQKLAVEYYSSGDYEKAMSLFEDLYTENQSSYIYRYLLYTYMQLEEYSKAEKMIKKAAKDNNKTYKKLSDLGYVELQKGKIEKAKKLFEKAIEELPANIAAVKELGNDFRGRGQTELAEKVYHRGQELLGDEYGFESELGYLYYYMEKYELMTDAYLDLLARQPNTLRSAEYRFQNAFRRNTDDDLYPYLKTELLKRIKKQPEQKQFSELLLWLTIQRQDFTIALIQAKSLDRQEGNEAYRVFDLAQIMQGHDQYALSIKTYKYLLALPDAKHQVYYSEVMQALVSSEYMLLQQDKNPEENDLQQLNKAFVETIDELGRNRFSIPILLDYAEFQSFYLYQPDQAIEGLEDLLTVGGLNNNDKAPVKLLLGDLYLLHDNPWDATLLYSQVDKDFKNDELGFDAKMRNAKLSFYIGEFEWAKAQLDVLKAATDKKIANNAMQLSLFISENLDADSSTRALELFGKAELLHLRKQDSLALQTLDSIFMLSLYHEIFDDVWFRKAEIYGELQQYDKSKEFLEKIVDQYSFGLLADDALFKLAYLEEIKFNNITMASERYKQILTDYPSSIYANEARENYRRLRGDDLSEKE